MPGNNVDIVIRTLQRREEETESVTQRAEGRLDETDGGWSLSYREGAESGLGETRTTLRLERGRAVLTRTGEAAGRMVFQPGLPWTCEYATPYGKMPMTIHTLHLESELTGAGGKVFLVYKLQLAGADVGENRLRLTVKTKENRYG